MNKVQFPNGAVVWEWLERDGIPVDPSYHAKDVQNAALVKINPDTIGTIIEQTSLNGRWCLRVRFEGCGDVCLFERDVKTCRTIT